MNLVADASVAVKWFFPEEHHEAAREILNQGWKLIAPDLIWAEFGSVIAKKIKKHETSLGSVSNIVDLFRQYPLEPRPMEPLLTPAIAIAEHTRISVYDAFYLALAYEEKCGLVTADRALCAAAGRIQVDHTWIGAGK